MEFTDGTRDNASWAAKQITFDKTRFWQSQNLATAVLVHEYHHYRSKRLGTYYGDEFVAHWKQYLAMKVQKTAAELNYFLLDDPAGYQIRTNPTYTFSGQEFTSPEDADFLWTRWKDNI